jgi:hypothetical protein
MLWRVISDTKAKERLQLNMAYFCDCVAYLKARNICRIWCGSFLVTDHYIL